MRAYALAFVIVTAAGCGSDGVSIEEAPDLFRDQYCKYLARCGLVPSEDECHSMNIGLTLGLDPSLEAAIDQGKVKYDGSKLESCYSQIGSFTCDRTDEAGRQFGGGACRDAIKGTVGDGGQCAVDEECKSLVCNVPDCPDACCQGTCVGDSALAFPRHLGESCESTSDCESRAYCDSQSGVCAMLKAAGASCFINTECDFGLGCAGTPRVCKVLPVAGEACPDSVCRDEGTYCAQPAKICQQVGLPGDACTTRSDCSSYYVCDATMHCANGPREGEACTLGTPCSDVATFCDTMGTMTCKRRQANGAACTSDTQCESNFCGDGMPRVCETEPICI